MVLACCSNAGLVVNLAGNGGCRLWPALASPTKINVDINLYYIMVMEMVSLILDITYTQFGYCPMHPALLCWHDAGSSYKC
jgi:hypothetical protein